MEIFSIIYMLQSSNSYVSSSQFLGKKKLNLKQCVNAQNKALGKCSSSFEYGIYK